MSEEKTYANESLIVIGFIAIIIASVYVLYNSRKSIDILQFWKRNIPYLNTSKECVIVLREHYGRLGNHLFMFASAYGLSLNRSCRLYIDSHIIKKLNQSFEIHLSNLLSRSQLNHFRSITKLFNHCSFFPYLLQSNNSMSIELEGYWQVYKYFIDAKEEIRRQLRFRRSIQNRVKNFLEKNFLRNHSTTTTFIGIHIRRGDYLRAHNVSSTKYIFDAMHYFQVKYYLPIFVIVSDDKSYCRQIFNQTNHILFTPNSFDAIDDLATLTLCNHTILTVGTFGWWGAFLLQNQQGDILSDSKPDHTPLDINCQRDDYFPPWFTFLNKTN